MATASSRTSTPGRGSEGLPPITEYSSAQSKEQPKTKSSSLNFLRRSRSTEPLNERRLSGKSKKMSKAQALEEERRQRESMPRHAPRLPDLSPTPRLETFGGEEQEQDRPDSIAMFSSQNFAYPPPPPRHAAPEPPLSSPTPSDFHDPYARTESMTHRGRYSYASSAVSTSNNPRRLRRRKDPTPYNVLVIGAKNSGKTSFLNFLRKSLTMPPHKHPSRSPGELEEYEHSADNGDGYTSHYLETEIDGERVGLTLWDSQGLERSIVDIQLRGVTGFLEGKFEDTLREETKVIRSPGVRDTHIHCTFLVLDPVRLDENTAAAERAANGNPKASDSPTVGILDKSLDLQVLRTVLGKTTVVPIISKADTITAAHMAYLRKAVWNSLKEASIDPLEILTLEDQEYTSSESADEEEVTKDEKKPQPKATESEATRPEEIPEKIPEETPEDTPEDTPEADQPEETQPEENKPKEAQPEETQPEETQPEETKPEEAQTGETQPEETPAAEEQEAPEAEAEAAQPEEEDDDDDDDEEEEQDTPSERSRKSSSSQAVAQNLPFSILSPDPHSLAAGDEPVGRKFPWGFADPYNPEHCDFVKLKNNVFSDWRSELREASRVIWYENWRTSLLHSNGANGLPQRKTGRMGPDGRRTR